MFRRTATLIAVVLASNLLLAAEVVAQTALNRAVVQTVRNRVQVLRQNQSPRAARVSDVLTPGNGVSTARSSFAELRFNDGSLGRLGEQVVFWFSAGTRNFRLSNGTVLMLIPPGQGRTQIRTPNAAAGIQGSALFVRYIPETDTTIVGALTDSGIEVFNRNGSQRQALRGGQMVVAVGDRIERIYDFDLNVFYETSELVRGLAPTEESNTGGSSDPAIAQVQVEMQTAIAQQQPLPADQIIETPNFVRRPANSSDPAATDLAPPDGQEVFDGQDGFSSGELEVPALEDRLDQVITDPRIDERRSPSDRPIEEYPDESPPIDRPDNGGETPIDRPDDGGETPIEIPDDGGESPIDRPDDGGETPVEIPDDDDGESPIDRPDDGGETPVEIPDDDDGEQPSDGPGNSDGVPGGGNTNGPGNSDGVPGGGNSNNNPANRNDRSNIDRDRARNSNGRSRL
ncbi:FecR domain-containing protein [Microcoleus sp. FACHB-1515]|uniref:FecR domain-containing protein n=1 Tax=Cyanophyceae TaxID=3028117 RepID=UPI0018EF5C39|nr:FecR domain-containing protein [Microcoleus sp. FACHB-1515]